MEKSNQTNGQSHLYLTVTNQIVELLESQKLTRNRPGMMVSDPIMRVRDECILE